MAQRKNETRREGGYTLLEMLVAVAILGMLATISVSAFQRIREQSASESLLLVLEALLGEARSTAVMRSSYTAIRFQERDGAVYARLYRDGDGDGVTREDVRRNLDTPIGPEQLLRADQSRVAIPDGAESDPAGAPLKGVDAVRFGRGDCLSFSPTATATPGTLYLAEGDGTKGWAIRVAGLDGRVRLWRFKAGNWFEVQAM